MFTDGGLLKMLDAQRTYLATLTWKLYVANTAILETTVIGDLGAEAAWGGYLAVGAGAWNTPTTVTPRAVSQEMVFPVFFNTSGVDQNFYVVALVDTAANVLVWANNLGLSTIPSGLSFTFSASVTDKEE
jgi:hypothetical protein